MTRTVRTIASTAGFWCGLWIGCTATVGLAYSISPPRTPDESKAYLQGFQEGMAVEAERSEEMREEIVSISADVSNILNNSRHYEARAREIEAQ